MRATKKQLEEALAAARSLLDAATRRAAEQEAIATARLAEVQQLQDEVVVLQVHLGEALDRAERFREMLVEDAEREVVLLRKANETAGDKLRVSFARFLDAIRIW